MNPQLIKVLLIDGAAQNREQYQRWLAQEASANDAAVAYAFFEAAQANVGQALALQHQPEVILIEQELLYQTELLGQTEKFLCPPWAIVVIADQGNVATAVSSLKAGAQEYLLKAELTPIRLRQAVGEAISRAQQHRQIQRYLVQSNPGQQLNDLTLVPVEDDESEINCLAPSGIDLFDRTEAERQLRRNQAITAQQLYEIEEIYHNIPIGLALVDQQLRYVRINQHLAKINGMTPADHIGRSVREMLPDLADKIEPMLRSVLETGEPVINREVRGETPSQPGVKRVWLASWHPFYGSHNEVAGVNIVTQEITNRKRTEADLVRSKRRYKTLFNSIDNGFSIIEMIFDSAGLPINYRFLEVNPAFAEQTGLPVDAVGKTVLELIPDLEFHWIERYGQVALTGESAHFEQGSEALGRWFEVYTCRLGEPEAHQVAIVFNDVSDRKRIEQEQEKLLAQTQAAKEEAEEASRLKDEFLAIVSHELRTPLNPILGWSQLMIRGRLSAEKTTQALEIIDRNAKMQAQLIDDLLDVSRILRGKLSLELTPVNLEQLVQTGLESIRFSAEAKSIQIKVHKAGTVFFVSGDTDRLQQILLNLLTNAVKFTPQDGHIDIWLKAALDGTIQLAVQDNGRGIPAQFLPYVFARFRQQDTSTTRKFGGLGLGLSIVHHLVCLHQGRVWVESPGENQGTTFTVSLPALDIKQVFSPNEVKTASPVRLNKVRILLVDDDADALEVTAFLLEDAGATVTAVSDARSGLTCLAESSFDLLISDIGMPDMDGYQFLECIRAQSDSLAGTIPAIALTAYANDMDHRRAIEAGFQQHLSKPVQVELLVATAARLAGVDSTVSELP